MSISLGCLRIGCHGMFWRLTRWHETRTDSMVRGVVICTPRQISFGRSNKGECDRQGLWHVMGEERLIEDFGGEA
jgi:hypothetical protein